MPLAKVRRRVLPSSMQRPWAVSDRNHVFGARSRSGSGSQPIPFTLTTFLCTLQPGHFEGDLLIAKLQHSILGVRLTLTQAGVTPARLQLISSPHLHPMVTQLSVMNPVDG
jgi:hypothetical protein